MKFTTPWLIVSALLLTACGGGGGGSSSPPPSSNPPPVVVPPVTPPLPDPSTAPALKDVFAPSFEIGAAIEPWQLDEAVDRALLIRHYNSITAENAMKPDTIAPVDPSDTPSTPYNFGPADTLVDFAMDNDMEVHGHTLVWHATAPDWFFARDAGMDDITYRNTVAQRLYDYVFDVVTYFSGRVASWDVVNEVASDGTGPFRENSPWFQAFSTGGMDGGEYIRIAFQAARAADPTALLFINDYSTEFPDKLARVLEIVEYVESAGIDVDGVGHQFHLQRSSSATSVADALDTVEALNLLNRVTELDISIYSDPGSCFANGTGCQADYGANFANIPQAFVSEQATLYRELFEVFVARDATIGAVTTWGISDAHTWLDFFPVNRKNRPLLFDTEGDPKLAFWAVADSTIEIP